MAGKQRFGAAGTAVAAACCFAAAFGLAARFAATDLAGAVAKFEVYGLPQNLLDMSDEHEAHINNFIDMLAAWNLTSEEIGAAATVEELRGIANISSQVEPLQVSADPMAGIFGGKNYKPKRTGEYDDKYNMEASGEYIHNADDLPRLHIIGDSVTAGCCCEGGGGYAAVLGDSLAKKDYHVDVIAGCGKTASAQDGHCNNRKDWGPNFWQKTGWSKMCKVTGPDVVLIMLGSNDRALPWSCTSSGFSKGLGKIIDDYKNVADPPRIILAIPPAVYIKKDATGHVEMSGGVGGEKNKQLASGYTAVHPTCPGTESACAGHWAGASYATGASPLFEGSKECIGNCVIPQKIHEVAAQKQVAVLDVSKILSHDEMDGHTGMHPNCQGHATLARHISNEIFSSTDVARDKASAKKRHALVATAKAGASKTSKPGQ